MLPFVEISEVVEGQSQSRIEGVPLEVFESFISHWTDSVESSSEYLANPRGRINRGPDAKEQTAKSLGDFEGLIDQEVHVALALELYST